MSITSNKTIEVRPIKRTRPFFKADHDGAFMFSGTYKEYTLPYINDTRSYANPFESPEEQEEFERVLQLAPGALSINNRNSDFWSTFKVQLSKEGKVLDLNYPMHVLEYRVLKANTKRICPNWEDRNRNSAYEFALIDKDVEEVNDIKDAERNLRAMELFIKMRKSNKKMYDILRVLGKKLPKEASVNTSQLIKEIDQIIAEKSKVGGVLNIDDFIEAAEDPKLSLKVFVLDAIEIGEIEISKGIYKITSNQTAIGRNLSEAVDYFDSIKGREDKLLIEQRLEMAK
jgi:hypothetical protein